MVIKTSEKINESMNRFIGFNQRPVPLIFNWFMRRIEFNVLCIVTILALLSCDPSSSVSYKIVNDSGSMAKIMLHSDVNYRICRADSAGSWALSLESDTVCLKVGAVLEHKLEWVHSSLQSHVPLWERIEAICIGDSVIPAAQWRDRGNWQVDEKGGGQFDLEHVTYTLYLYKFMGN